MQYDFGSLPSSCQVDTDTNNNTRASSAVNESPKRNKRVKRAQEPAAIGDEEASAVTWQNSSSPAHNHQISISSASATSLSHLRDRSKTFYSNSNDPASELRAKFAPLKNNRLASSSIGSSTGKRPGTRAAGRLMSLPASRVSVKKDLDSMIGRVLDNLDQGISDGDGESHGDRGKDRSNGPGGSGESTAVRETRSLPSSPPLNSVDLVHSDDDEEEEGNNNDGNSSSDLDVDWNELEQAAEVQLQSFREKNSSRRTENGPSELKKDETITLEEDQKPRRTSTKPVKSSPIASPLKADIASDDFSDIDMEELDKALSYSRSNTQIPVPEENKKEHRKNDNLEHSNPQVAPKETVIEKNSGNDSLSDGTDSDCDLDLGALEQEVSEKRAAERSNFRKDSTAKKFRSEEKETLDDTYYVIKRPDFERLMVSKVESDTYSQNNLDQFTVHAYNQAKQSKTIYLRDMWTKSAPSVGDIIHLIGDFDHNAEEVVVDRSNNYLVVHPDYLVTATNVADSFYCERKIVLRDRIRQLGGNIINKQMLYGDLVHRLFELCLRQNNFNRPFMEEQIKRIVESDYFEAIILMDLTMEDLLADMSVKIGQLIKFRNRYLQKKPHAASVVQEHRLNRNRLMSVCKVVDTEEDIWSPVFGLQGKVDVTVETAVKNEDGSTVSRYLAPLELKTAQFNRLVGHRAQTTLYTLMMADRYEIDVSFGLLYYSESCDMHMIPILRDEVAALLAQRNYLAGYMKARQEIPQPLQDSKRCEYCNLQGECMVYHKCVEKGTADTAGTDQMFFDNTDHLREHHMEFFRHWDDLMVKEGLEGSRLRKEIWTMSSKTREEAGRCFGNLRIKPSDDGIKQLGENWSVYVLERAVSQSSSAYEDGRQRVFKYSDSQLTPSDRIVVSDESGHCCLATGFVRNITGHEIEIQIDRRLENCLQKTNDFDAVSNQTYIPRFGSDSDSSSLRIPHNNNSLFRIDLDPYEKSMALARGNMMQMFVKDGSENLRRLIVDSEAPTFSDQPLLQHSIDTSKYNSDQINAVDMVMRAQDYALILGMPGTGKTTTIAGIIKSLVNAGKSILLTSFTHSAVDNICLKIRDQGFEVCRLASVLSRVHPDCQDLVPVVHEGDELTKEATEKKYMDPPVIATTCLSINHWLFGIRHFDYCIIDEASQLTLPVSVGPLRFADKFILVGDHYQLQPVIKNPEAASGGLKQSLFERLSIAHPNATVNLEHQYRMCEDVMLLSNELVYEGKLKCGSEEVANQSLKLSDTLSPATTIGNLLKQQDTTRNWLGHVAEEK